MSKQNRLISTFIIVCVLWHMAFAARALPWQVLVIAKNDQKTDVNNEEWNTFWSNGKQNKSLNGLVFPIDKRLYWLKIKTLRDQGSCLQGKFPFAYEVDELIAEPLSGDKEANTKCLYGQNMFESAKAIMHDHLSACDEIKILPFAPPSIESYEHSKIKVLSNFNGCLGLEVLTESFAYGHPTAMVQNDWGIYQLEKGLLVRQNANILPKTILTQAKAKFQLLPTEKTDQFTPTDFTHFVFVPSGGGARLEFGVPGTIEASRKNVCMVALDKVNGLNNAYDKMKLSFIRLHPHLIDWKKTSFYTISPDQSFVVFAQNGALYFQATSGGSAKFMGKARAIKGWQWYIGEDAAKN